MAKESKSIVKDIEVFRSYVISQSKLEGTAVDPNTPEFFNTFLSKVGDKEVRRIFLKYYNSSIEKKIFKRREKAVARHLTKIYQLVATRQGQNQEWVDGLLNDPDQATIIQIEAKRLVEGVRLPGIQLATEEADEVLSELDQVSFENERLHQSNSKLLIELRKAKDAITFLAKNVKAKFGLGSQEVDELKKGSD